MERVLITDGTAPVSRVSIGRGIKRDVPSLVGEARYGRVAVFTQKPASTIADAVAGSLRDAGAVVHLRVLPDREAAKSMQVAESCYRWLNGLGITRGDLIVAVGGGALTDLAGFVAATYLRGLAITLVPTTLLGALDAAIGGKTAVNVDGKNLAGVFKHPEQVVVDVDLLEKLPVQLLREGHAEALKAGLIADSSIVEMYEKHGMDVPLDQVTVKAITVKAEIVSGDFMEAGQRAILNYGHTVGHGIEVATGISHGDAVAIGMVAAGAASNHALGFTGQARQRSIISSLGLPVAAPEADAAVVRDLMNLDKKRDDSGARMVLLEDFGRPVLTHVDAATVEAAFQAIGLV